jgi:hypothetical protein
MRKYSFAQGVSGIRSISRVAEKEILLRAGGVA